MSFVVLNSARWRSVMIVFRITTAKWATVLDGSGYPARWNPRHIRVIYTAGSAALACLENLAHRSGEGLNANFRLVEIKIPENTTSDSYSLDDLPENWHTVRGYAVCQMLGSEWVKKNETCILRVPSSIIPSETNVLINPNHPHFHQISIQSTRKFSFDERLTGRGL